MNLYAAINEINICQCKKLQININGIDRNYFSIKFKEKNTFLGNFFELLKKIQEQNITLLVSSRKHVQV